MNALDTMSAAEKALRNPCGPFPGTADALTEARAAVAELQLRAAAMLAAASASAARREPLSADAPAIVNLRAALARFGGTP
jgi:hypothetical protein